MTLFSAPFPWRPMPSAMPGWHRYLPCWAPARLMVRKMKGWRWWGEAGRTQEEQLCVGREWRCEDFWTKCRGVVSAFVEPEWAGPAAGVARDLPDSGGIWAFSQLSPAWGAGKPTLGTCHSATSDRAGDHPSVSELGLCMGEGTSPYTELMTESL